jgi:hypothetical protein
MDYEHTWSPKAKPGDAPPPVKKLVRVVEVAAEEECDGKAAGS